MYPGPESIRDRKSGNRKRSKGETSMKHLRKVSVAPAAHCPGVLDLASGDIVTNLLSVITGLSGDNAIGCLRNLIIKANDA